MGAAGNGRGRTDRGLLDSHPYARAAASRSRAMTPGASRATTPGAGLVVVLLLAGLIAVHGTVAGPASAQTLQGRIVEHGDKDSPVSGATVTLADTAGEPLRAVVADSAGRFWLWHAEPGAYRLTIERLGYATVAGQPVRLVADSVVELEIGLQPEAVAVDPIRVVTSRRVRRYTADEFYDRMGRLADRGSFVTKDEIAAMGVGLPSEVIRRLAGTWVEKSGRSTVVNSISLVSYGRRCSPAIYLDGRELKDGRVLDEAIMVDRIEGIEIYRGNFVPDGYFRDIDSWGCGFILAWTKQEPDPRFAFSWGRTLLFAALGGLVWALSSSI